MSGLEKALFNLKASQSVILLLHTTHLTTITDQFTAKQLNRQAAKAGKDETAEKSKLKKVLHEPHPSSSNEPLSQQLTPAPPLPTGHPTKPHRHRQNLRPERHPQTERKAQPPSPSQPHRRRQQPRPNSSHHAPGNRQHGKRSPRHGRRNEEHGSGKSGFPPFPFPFSFPPTPSNQPIYPLF